MLYCLTNKDHPTYSHTQVLGVEICRLTNKDHPAYSSPRSISLLGGLCFSDGITLRVASEHVGWSLFVRQYNSTRGT
jgi:hypothetical protein